MVQKSNRIILRFGAKAKLAKVCKVAPVTVYKACADPEFHTPLREYIRRKAKELSYIINDDEQEC